MIAATKLTPAVACLRMSSDKQDKSIADQLTEVRKLAVKEGYNIIRWKEYTDEGISGDDDKRDGFLRLIHDAKTIRDFDAVLCWSQDRFSRWDILKTAPYWDILRDAGIKLHTVCEGEVSFDNIGDFLKASVNQYGANEFLKKLSFNVSRGFASSTRAGFWSSGTAPFGYRLIKVGDGKVKRTKLAVDPAMSAHVVWLFKTFIKADLSYKALAVELNARGVPTARGAKWSAKTVQDILRNEVYIGTLIRGRRACGKHCRTVGGEPVKLTRRLPALKQSRSDCIVVEDAFPAIIDRATWTAAQMRLSKNGNGRKARANKYPLSGLARCGCCGHPISGKYEKQGGYRWYICQSGNFTDERKEGCRFTLGEDALMKEILDQLYTNWLTDSKIELLRKETTEFIKRQRGDTGERDTTIRAELVAREKAVAKAEARLMTTPDDMLPALYKAIRDEREHAEHLRAKLSVQSRIVAISEEAVADIGNRLVAELKAARSDIKSSDPAKVRACLQQFVERVVIYTRALTPAEKAAHKSPNAKRCLDRIQLIYHPTLFQNVTSCL